MKDRTRLSILFATAPGDVGGLETVVAELATGLSSRGHRVVVAAVVEPHSEPEAFLEAVRQTAVDVRVIRIPARAYGREWRAFRILCREVRPDVVHTHGHRSDLLDAVVAKRDGYSIVTTLHGFSGLGGVARLYEWAQVLSLRRFDAVVVVSRALARSMQGRWVARDRLHLIPNARARLGMCLERGAARRVLRLSGTAPVVGWVGRLVSVKAAHTLLDAVPLIRNRDVQIAIVGDGPERESLERRAVALGIGRQVTFHGSLPKAQALFRAFDVFVMTSISEGTPMVLLEAMAANVPVVATRVGGIPDVLGVGGGLLVEPGDPPGLAKAIADTLADRPRAMERAGAASARLEAEYSPDRWLDRYEELYYSLKKAPTGARLAAQPPGVSG